MKVPRWLGVIACAFTALFWGLGVGVPVFAVLSRVSSQLAVFWDRDVMTVAWVTARQSIMSTAIATALGVPLGLLAARASPKLARWIDAWLLLPQGVPTVVAATAWVAWLGRSGVLARLDLGYSLSAVILAHVFFNAPWIALLVAQSRRQIAQSQVEAAATLGAGAWARLRWVIWPELKWACAAAAAQVAAVCSMSFALVLILGGGPPVETLETALYSRLRGGGLDLGGAAACAAWEILLTLTPWVLVLFLRARSARKLGVSIAASGVRPLRASGLVALVLALLFFAPYLLVFTRGGISAWASPEFWLEAAAPLRLSLLIAALASVGALLAAALATLATQVAPPWLRTAVGAILAVPSGLSVLVLGLGGWLAYSRWIDPFEGSLTAIVALQVIVFFPVALRMLWPLAQAGQEGQMQAAWTLGASPWRAFWLVDWPRWRPTVFSALALVLGMALGEVAAVSLFYSEKLVPLPLLVSRWMGQYRFDDARAVAALLLVSSMALMAGVSMGGSRGARI